MDKYCKDCKHFNAYSHLPDNHENRHKGDCKRFPEVVIKADLDYCGEFNSKYKERGRYEWRGKEVSAREMIKLIHDKGFEQGVVYLKNMPNLYSDANEEEREENEQSKHHK